MRPRGPHGMLLSIGNRKIGADTLTLNMGSATDCPSEKLGLCKVVKRFRKTYACFSKNAEKYQHVLPRRRQQELYWKNTAPEFMLADLSAILTHTRAHIRYFRFNESGDFWGQESVVKADIIASFLKIWGITSYCNTARSDLDFTDVDFLVRGSGWKAPCGMTIVVTRQDHIPKGFHVCPQDCKICHQCKTPFSNIAFPYHSAGRKPKEGGRLGLHLRYQRAAALL